MTSIIGAPGARTTLYLLKPPVLDGLPDGQIPTVEEIVQRNGNNWRKILTIFSKLCTPDDDWNSYRDQQLLQQWENISFTPQLLDHNGWHLVAGKGNWQAQGYNTDEFEDLDDKSRLFIRQRLVLMPYPDYRQFPNQLIELLRERMRAESANKTR